MQYALAKINDLQTFTEFLVAVGTDRSAVKIAFPGGTWERGENLLGFKNLEGLRRMPAAQIVGSGHTGTIKGRVPSTLRF